MTTRSDGSPGARSDDPARAERAPQQNPRAQEPQRDTSGPTRTPGCSEQVQQTLDDALADSFPASDPVSIVTSQREEAWEPQPEAERERHQRRER